MATMLVPVAIYELMFKEAVSPTDRVARGVSTGSFND